MQKTTISVVAYANSLPFVYGLLHSPYSDSFDVQIDIPAVCADKIIQNKVDISLVPVAEMLRLNDYQIISNLCIGANDYVRTVLLVADCPLNEIKEIYLDYQSRTSVVLVKVLAKHFWNIEPTWKKAFPEYENNVIKNNTGAVIIGDRTFLVKNKFQYDLSHEWKKFTKMPFVFAAWLSNKNIPQNILDNINNALQFGVNNLSLAVETYNKTSLPNHEICRYLVDNINYLLNDEKKIAMQQFLKYAKEFV